MHRPPRSHSYPITGVTCKLRRRVSTLHALSSRVVVRGGAAVLWCSSRAVWTGNWRGLFGLDTSTVSQLGWASARGCHAHVLKNGALFGAAVTYHILLRVPTMLFTMTHITRTGFAWIEYSVSVNSCGQGSRGYHARVLKNGALFGACVNYHILLRVRVPTMLFNMTHITQVGVFSGGGGVGGGVPGQGLFS